jgi:hypothetical protein
MGESSFAPGNDEAPTTDAILATPDIAVVIVESFAEVHLLAALAIARIPVAILLTGQLPEFNRTKAVAAAELAQRASLLARSICERSLIVLRATLNARRDPKWATLLCSAAADAFGVAQWPWFAQRPSS